MGWNALEFRAGLALLAGVDGADVYFAHSYAAEPDDEEVDVRVVDHDGAVVAAVESGPGRRPVPPRAERRRRRPCARERAAMVKKRLIPCLDVAAAASSRASASSLRDVGDPVELAERLLEVGVDELVFLDITASVEGRRPLLELVERRRRSV